MPEAFKKVSRCNRAPECSFALLMVEMVSSKPNSVARVPREGVLRLRSCSDDFPRLKHA